MKLLQFGRLFHTTVMFSSDGHIAFTTIFRSFAVYVCQEGYVFVVIMVALWNRADRYIFILWFLVLHLSSSSSLFLA